MFSTQILKQSGPLMYSINHCIRITELIGSNILPIFLGHIQMYRIKISRLEPGNLNF